MRFATRRASIAALLMVLGSAVVACSADPPEKSTTTPPTPNSNFDYDAEGCLNVVDHHETAPFGLKGRLVVTYFEPSLLATMCEWDEETSQHWCPSASRLAADCADVDGAFWCPTPNPPAERLGDPQEMGLFDLSNPGAGVQRWTHNTMHEAEMDISPDGTTVIYAVRGRLDEFESGQGIWSIGMDGLNPTRLTKGSGYAGIPTWVPPASDRFTYCGNAFHLFDLGTKTTTEIVPDGTSLYLMDPEASYDGQRIVFKAEVERVNAPDVYVMQFDGSNVRHLTTGYSDHDPVFSLDNRRVYFERYYGPGAWDQYAELDRGENPEINQWGIVEVDVETAEERVIIPHDPCGRHFFWLPTVSPDGEHIMFIHDYVDGAEGYQDLWVSDKDGRNAQRVPNTDDFYWFDWTH